MQQPQLQTQNGPVCTESLSGIPHSGKLQALTSTPKNPDYLWVYGKKFNMVSFLWSLQLFFKNRGIINEEGFILFVRKNAIIILIPKFGLEGTVFFENKDKPSPHLTFDSEVRINLDISLCSP